METAPLLKMATQKPPQQASFALRPKTIASLRHMLFKLGDKAPQDGAAVARQSSEEEEADDDDDDDDAGAQFRRFPDLPTELRLQIWAEATRYKRYVVLVPPCNSAAGCLKLAFWWVRYRKSEAAAGGARGECPPAWTSRTTPPPLLSVSREAREVALKTWRLAFGIGPSPPSVVRTSTEETFSSLPSFFKPFPCVLCVAVVPGSFPADMESRLIDTRDHSPVLRFVYCETTRGD